MAAKISWFVSLLSDDMASRIILTNTDPSSITVKKIWQQDEMTLNVWLLHTGPHHIYR